MAKSKRKKSAVNMAKAWSTLAGAVKPIKRIGKSAGQLAWTQKMRSCGAEFRQEKSSGNSKSKEKRRVNLTPVIPAPVAKAIVRQLAGPIAGVTHDELAKKRGEAFDKWEQRINDRARASDLLKRARKI